MDSLFVGQQINIQRSNGHVHGVVVTKLHPNFQIVTVEWNESNEIKGKEVTLESIIPLNPTIFKPALPSRLDSKTYMSLTPKSMRPEQLERQVLKTTMQENFLCKSNIPISRMSIMTVNKATNAQDTTINVATVPKPKPAKPHMSRASYALDTRRVADDPTSKKQTLNAKPADVPIEVKRAQSFGSKGKASTSLKVTTAASTSCVVKRINQMKENREKQRAKNALARQAKQELQGKDPDNPNWEIAHMIREYQQRIDFHPLHKIGEIEPISQQITVCVRKRPLSRKEEKKHELDVVAITRRNLVVVHEPRNKVDLTKFLDNHAFRFDYTFDESCSNEMVYHYTAKPLVHTIFEGGNATCFAYGQTGSGKTHTMGGEFHGKEQLTESGIYTMVAKDVFTVLKAPKYCNKGLFVACSFFEIYAGKVFDLLTEEKKLLRVLEDGRQQVQVVGLTEVAVNDVHQVLEYIKMGGTIRTSGQTSANVNSSRSHAIFQIVLHCEAIVEPIGKFSIIDLAGNERGADTFTASRQTRLEGAEINKSLLALKECIRAMARQSTHLPFRGSTLTQVLRDSFVGGQKNKTCMIAMISPGLSCCEHTLNTLRYADRVKEMIVNERSTSKTRPGYIANKSDDDDSQ